jgi:streptomycin 3"-adenylyltransferase
VTGEIRSKDAAAGRALARLPAEHRPVLAHARAVCLGDEEEHWADLETRMRPFARHVAGVVAQLF